jgi:hypothetical protein
MNRAHKGREPTRLVGAPLTAPLRDQVCSVHGATLYTIATTAPLLVAVSNDFRRSSWDINPHFVASRRGGDFPIESGFTKRTRDFSNEFSDKECGENPTSREAKTIHSRSLKYTPQAATITSWLENSSQSTGWATGARLLKSSEGANGLGAIKIGESGETAGTHNGLVGSTHSPKAMCRFPVRRCCEFLSSSQPLGISK